MLTKAQRRHKMVMNIVRLQNDMADNWLDRSIPEDWNFLDIREPVEPHKTKITMRMDADMHRWFKKRGPNYQRRINQVLRVYYVAMVQGELETHWAHSEKQDLAEQYLDAVLELQIKEG